MRAMRAYASGSCRRSQRSFGAVNPVSARFPVRAISRSSPTRSSISAHSAAVRWSFQRIAGRITSPAASRHTSPCICPEKPDPGDLEALRDLRESAHRAAHQSSGSCSDQPGLRRRERIPVLRARDHLARRADGERLHARRADVESDRDRHAAAHPELASRPQQATPCRTSRWRSPGMEQPRRIGSTARGSTRQVADERPRAAHRARRGRHAPSAA